MTNSNLDIIFNIRAVRDFFRNLSGNNLMWSVCLVTLILP